MFVDKLRNLTRHSGLRRYLKNTAWLLSGHVIRMLVALFVSVAIARHLGTGDFGQYNFILSLVALFGISASLGLESVLKRELVRHPHAGGQLIGSSMAASALVSLLLYGLFLGVVGQQRDQSDLFLLSMILGATILLVPFRFLDIWFESQTRGDLSVICAVSVVLAFAMIKLLALAMDAGLPVFCIIYTSELATLAAVQVGVYHHGFHPSPAWGFSFQSAGKLIGESWPLIFSQFAISVYTQMDHVMLGFMRGEAAVGAYAAAAKISSIWYFIPIILAASLFPAIVRGKELGVDTYRLRLQRYFDLNAGLAYLIILPISLLSPWIIALLYGEAFSAAAPILTVHAWAALFVFMGVARNQYLITEGFLKFSMLATGLGAVFNIGLNGWLIPAFGGIGAAWATVLSYAISACLSSIVLSKGAPIWKMQLMALSVPLNPIRPFRPNA